MVLPSPLQAQILNASEFREPDNQKPHSVTSISVHCDNAARISEKASFKMKLLASFLKREHNVTPRVFDEALYAVSIYFEGFEDSSDAYDGIFDRCTICHFYLGTTRK